MNALITDVRVRVSVVAVLVLLSLFLLVETIGSVKEFRFIGAGVMPANTISVSGEGEVFAVPDIATFSFSVVEEAETVASAQQEASTRMNEAIDFLEDAGVEEKDIKTTGFNVFPRYEFRERAGVSFPRPPSGERVLIGFEVRQSITVKVRETKEVGELLSRLSEIGVSEISGLSFTIDDDEALLAEARDKAIEDAKEKADALADALDISLVRIVSFQESNGGIPRIALESKTLGESVDNAVIPNIPTGENRIVSNVTIIYEIR